MWAAPITSLANVTFSRKYRFFSGNLGSAWVLGKKTLRADLEPWDPMLKEGSLPSSGREMQFKLSQFSIAFSEGYKF